MDDFRWWQRRARAVVAGAVAMTLLWPCVALYRGTSEHDWYAAVKLTLTEAMIAAGFNSFEVTRYRAPDGTSSRITRGGLVESGEVIDARERIVYTALVGALHGGLAGALGVVLVLMQCRAVIGWQSLRAGWAKRPPVQELSETFGAVELTRAVPAQRSLEQSNPPLLAAADTAGSNAEPAGTKTESADLQPATAGAPAQPVQAKAGDGDKPRASPDPTAPVWEDTLVELDDGGNVNWL